MQQREALKHQGNEVRDQESPFEEIGNTILIFLLHCSYIIGIFLKDINFSSLFEQEHLIVYSVLSTSSLRKTLQRLGEQANKDQYTVIVPEAFQVQTTSQTYTLTDISDSYLRIITLCYKLSSKILQ